MKKTFLIILLLLIAACTQKSRLNKTILYKLDRTDLMLGDRISYGNNIIWHGDDFYHRNFFDIGRDSFVYYNRQRSFLSLVTRETNIELRDDFVRRVDHIILAAGKVFLAGFDTNRMSLEIRFLDPGTGRIEPLVTADLSEHYASRPEVEEDLVDSMRLDGRGSLVVQLPNYRIVTFSRKNEVKVYSIDENYLKTEEDDNIVFQQLLLLKKEGHCCLVYHKYDKEGLEETILETYDFRSRISVSTRRVSGDKGLLTGVAGNKSFVFNDFSEKDNTGLYYYMDMDSLKVSHIRLFAAEDEAMPFDFKFFDDALYGFIKNDETLEFCRWN